MHQLETRNDSKQSLSCKQNHQLFVFWFVFSICLHFVFFGVFRCTRDVMLSAVPLTGDIILLLDRSDSIESLPIKRNGFPLFQQNKRNSTSSISRQVIERTPLPSLWVTNENTDGDTSKDIRHDSSLIIMPLCNAEASVVYAISFTTVYSRDGVV